MATKTTAKKTVKKEVQEAKWNGFTIAGFATSFISPAVLGLIFSIIGLKDARANKDKGEGLAIAGIVISSISLFLTLIIGILPTS